MYLKLFILHPQLIYKVIFKDNKYNQDTTYSKRLTNIQRCVSCVMDNEFDSNIYFNNHGVCNYCLTYQNLSKSYHTSDLSDLIQKIQQEGAGKPYDSIIGLSGGIDSSYLLYKAKKLGLRPLVVHYDNGWNSETAVINIENILKKLDLDLYTHVNDWDEYKDLQLSFFKASVIDIELINDQAISAVLYREALKRDIKYVLFGTNSSSESILPEDWYHFKQDVLNIKAIHKRFGKIPLRTYPMMPFWKIQWIKYNKKIQTIPLLDYVNYDKEKAQKILTEEFGWKNYPGKHGESIFTRFYQGYILPTKFHVDKRKAHLSSLINSKQISRDQAIEALKKPIYESDEQLMLDRDLVIKKLGLTIDEFEKIMNLPVKKHTDYPSYVKRHYHYQKNISKFIKRAKTLFGLLKKE